MTAWSQPHTVKSNARRAAKKAGIDPTSVVSFVKAGKTLYRYALTPEKPKAKDTNGLRRMNNEDKSKHPHRVKGQAALNEVARRPAYSSPAVKAAATAVLDKHTVKHTKGGGRFHQVAALLRRPGGASMSVITAATGWKPHSARARISVDVTKILDRGEVIERSRHDGESHYSIVKSAQQDLPLPEPQAA